MLLWSKMFTCIFRCLLPGAHQREGDPDLGHIAHGGVDLVPICSLQLCLALLTNNYDAVLLALCKSNQII